MVRTLICSALAGFLFLGCATLQQLSALVQAPRFEQAPDRDPEIRLVGPGSGMPIGGAAVRLWTKVTNPNAFSLTLGTLKGTLFLEDSRAADADFPLGLPLNGGGETIVPIELSISFASIPGLADTIRRAINRQPVPYRLDGTVGVDAGRLGQPIFGPMTLLRGEIRQLPAPSFPRLRAPKLSALRRGLAILVARSHRATSDAGRFPHLVAADGSWQRGAGSWERVPI
jgi:hypothetical protein